MKKIIKLPRYFLWKHCNAWHERHLNTFLLNFCNIGNLQWFHKTACWMRTLQSSKDTIATSGHLRTFAISFWNCFLIENYNDIENNNIFSFQDSNAETVILISPKFGISQINSLRNSVVSIIFHYRGRYQKVKAQPCLSSSGHFPKL